MSHVRLNANRPLIVGEVLFDEFPGGHRILGGAPFNVAWNLQGLGLRPLFVSAVGADAEGEVVQEKMEAWDMDTTALRVATELPTGRVRVDLERGEPEYRILADQAYDEIVAPAFDAFYDDFSLLYYGSLAYRGPTSRTTIRRLIDESGLPRFVDINIRQPWFNREAAGELLSGAAWIKLSVDELEFLSNTACRSAGQIAEAVAGLRSVYRARCFFVTCGASGAYAIDEGAEVLFADAPTPTPFVDAVGAGDAFSAAAIVGVIRGLPLPDILAAAVQYASKTCQRQGATSTLREHYRLRLLAH